MQIFLFKFLINLVAINFTFAKWRDIIPAIYFVGVAFDFFAQIFWTDAAEKLSADFTNNFISRVKFKLCRKNYRQQNSNSVGQMQNLLR